MHLLRSPQELQRSYRLSILLLLVDVEDMTKPLADMTKAAVMNDVTLVCAWSPEECARCGAVQLACMQLA